MASLFYMKTKIISFIPRKSIDWFKSYSRYPPPHTHTHTHTRARAHTHTHPPTHARTHARTHIPTHAHTHTHTHTRKFFCSKTSNIDTKSLKTGFKNIFCSKNIFHHCEASSLRKQ